MLLGAGLEIVAAVVADATNGSLQPQFAAAMAGEGTGLVHAVTVAHGQTIVMNSIVACVLWLVMAYVNWRARSSTPRIISLILFVMGTGYLRQTFSDPNTVPTLIVAFAIWVVGVAAAALLFTETIHILFAKTVHIALRRGSTCSRTS